MHTQRRVWNTRTVRSVLSGSHGALQRPHLHCPICRLSRSFLGRLHIFDHCDLGLHAIWLRAVQPLRPSSHRSSVPLFESMPLRSLHCIAIANRPIDTGTFIFNQMNGSNLRTPHVRKFLRFQHKNTLRISALPSVRPAQAQRVNTLASGRPLGYGEYKDLARPLRRLLKQYGSGSLEGGLRFAKANGNALAELVALLNVDRPVRNLI